MMEDAQMEGEGDLSEIEAEMFQKDNNVFTHMTEPGKPERVQELLWLITICDDLST
jgi:hypothetical protein